MAYDPAAARRLVARLAARPRDARDRRRLSRLNDHTLRDIGLSRGDIEAGVGAALGDR